MEDERQLERRKAAPALTIVGDEQHRGGELQVLGHLLCALNRANHVLNLQAPVAARLHRKTGGSG